MDSATRSDRADRTRPVGLSKSCRRSDSPTGRRARAAFSLIELVIVVVIIGIIAAIAIPRMSRGTSGAAESALSADMSTWRHALDLYQAEHDGKYPTDNTTIVAQLTGNTDASGTIGSGTNFPYGPYLRAVPTLPVGDTGQKGQTAIGAYSTGPAPTSVI